MPNNRYIVVCSDGYRHQQVWPSLSRALLAKSGMDLNGNCKYGPHDVVEFLLGDDGDVRPPEVKMTISAAEQEMVRHNQWRYAELEKLRRGEANRYSETEYRH